MTRDDIIRMARKSGFAHGICWAAHEKDLLMFANLVAAAEREWQGLTDEEYEAMAEQYVTNCYFDTLKFARAIEAKLKEKNNDTERN